MVTLAGTCTTHSETGKYDFQIEITNKYNLCYSTPAREWG